MNCTTILLLIAAYYYIYPYSCRSMYNIIERIKPFNIASNADDGPTAYGAYCSDTDADEKLYAIIQEDRGKDYGERMIVTNALEHNRTPLSYYFAAMSGGNTTARMLAGVRIPAGVNVIFKGTFVNYTNSNTLHV